MIKNFNMAKPKYLSTFGSGKVKFYVHSIYIYIYLYYIYIFCSLFSSIWISYIFPHFLFFFFAFHGEIIWCVFLLLNNGGWMQFCFPCYIHYTRTHTMAVLHHLLLSSIRFIFHPIQIFLFFFYISRILTFLKTIVWRRWIPTTETDWWATSIYIHVMLIIMSVNY